MADQHRLMAEHEDQRLQQQQQQTSVSTSASTSTHSPRLSVVIGGGDPAAGEMQQQCIQSPSVVATRDHEQQTRKKTSFQITSVTVGSRASNDGGEDSADDLDESHTDDLSSELLDISKNTDEVCDIDQSPVAQTDVTVCDASTVAGGGGGGPGPGQTNVSVTVVETHTVPMAVAQHPDIQWQNRFKVVKIETGEPFRRGRWLCMNFHDPPASQGDVSEKEGTTGSGSGNSSAASSSHHGELVSGSESGQMTGGGFGVASAAGGMFGGSESGFYSGEAPIYPVSIILQTQQQGGNLDFTNTVVHMQGKTPDYTGTGQQLPPDYLHHHHHHHQQQQQQQQTLGHHVIPPHTVINPVSDFLQHQQGASLSLGSNVDYAFPPAPPDPSSPPPPHPPLAATGSVAVPVSCQADYPTATSTPNPVAMPAPSAAPLTTLMNVNPAAAAPQTEYSQVAAGPATTTGAVSASSVVMPNTSVAAPVLAAAPAGQSIGTGASGQPPAPVVPVPQLPQQQQQMSDGGGGIGTAVRPANIPLTVNATTAESLVEASVGVLMSPQPIKEQTADGDDAESASGVSTVAIDNKIEQAMDLVKSHLMFAVREEVDVLKEKITELMERISQLELENTMLRASASPETLAKLSTPAPTPSSTKTQQQPPTATS